MVVALYDGRVTAVVVAARAATMVMIENCILADVCV